MKKITRKQIIFLVVYLIIHFIVMIIADNMINRDPLRKMAPFSPIEWLTDNIGYYMGIVLTLPGSILEEVFGLYPEGLFEVLISAMTYGFVILFLYKLIRKR